VACEQGHVTLTPAEHRVAVCLLVGMAVPECAAHYGVTVATVRSHVSHLQRKFDTHSLHALVVAARQHEGCCVFPARERDVPGASEL
jgi:DNA-binding CsgD family transcriptional regulator